MGATIKFRDYTFDLAGTPQWGRRVEFEQQGDGLPRIARSTFTIKQTFEEQSFADNEAQIHLLYNSLLTGEGLLLIKDENGGELVRLVAKVKSHDVPQQWRQYIAEITVVLEARELVVTGDADASFTPTGGTQIALPNVQEWKQSTDTTRFNDERSNRRESKVAITASGVVLADKSLSIEARREALQAIKNTMRACASKDGTLLYGSDSNVVQVDRIDADIGDGSDRLNWSLSCFFKIYPGGDEYAEADYTLSSRDDLVEGERIVAVRGNIRAVDEATGKSKADQIRAQYATSNRILQRSELGDAKLDGADGQTWVDMTFNYEFREALDIITYELKVSTRTDVKNDDNTITYSGKVSALTTDVALTQARTLGLGKYPFMVSAEEVVTTRKSGTESPQMIDVTFSYEYVTKSDWKYAEVTREVGKDFFGDSREVVSGFCVAADATSAQNFAATFKLAGRLMRTSRETFGSRSSQQGSGTVNSQMTRFDFSYEYYLTPASVSVSYGREERTNYEESETSVVYSGIARGPSEAACRSVINGIVAGASGKIAETSRTPQFEKQSTGESGSAGAGTQLISVGFSDRFVMPSTGGPDILNAEFSKKTTYSVNKAVITPIPYGQPYVQDAVGWTPGLVVISGSVTARTDSIAQSWGRDRHSLLGGGYEDPPEEELATIYPPMEGNNPKQYRFNFTYSSRFPYLPY
jgi:hypothetical protein